MTKIQGADRSALRDALLVLALAAGATAGVAQAAALPLSEAKQVRASAATKPTKNQIVSRDDREQRRMIRTKLTGAIQRESTAKVSELVEGGHGEADSGIASVYSHTRTASGEVMIAGAMTAAHRTLPFGARVTVTNRHNGRSVVVQITDRGPFVRGRVIDLSPAAARALGIDGLAPVSIAVARHGEKQADAQNSEKPRIQDVAAEHVGPGDEGHLGINHVSAEIAEQPQQVDSR